LLSLFFYILLIARPISKMSVVLSVCLPARLHRYFDKVEKAGTPAQCRILTRTTNVPEKLLSNQANV
jgi:hypothetical protein